MKGERKRITKKKAIQIATVIVAILLAMFYSVLAFITVNGVADAGARDENAGTRFIAHRGYSAAYFDNTSQAFGAAARESFFQGIETDVRRTADGIFVCSHDENPFADKSIKIQEHTYDEIKELPLDTSGASPGADLSQEYRIATFSEYLTACSVYRKTAFVEIKQSLTREETVELVKQAYKVTGWKETVFGSFDRTVIEYVLSEYGYAKTMVFTGSGVKAFFYMRMGHNIGVNKSALSEGSRLIKQAHKAESFVNAYTVNDAEEAKRLMRMGVDYITTDTALEL